MINKMIVQTKQIKMQNNGKGNDTNDNQPSSPSNVPNNHSTVPSNTQPAQPKDSNSNKNNTHGGGSQSSDNQNNQQQNTPPANNRIPIRLRTNTSSTIT